MPSNTKENGFETLIVDTLVNSNGYEQGVTSNVPSMRTDCSVF